MNPVRSPRLQMLPEAMPAITKKLSAEMTDIVKIPVNLAIQSLSLVRRLCESDPEELFEVTEDVVNIDCPLLKAKVNFIRELPKTLPVGVFVGIIQDNIREELGEANGEVWELTGAEDLIDIDLFLRLERASGNAEGSSNLAA